MKIGRAQRVLNECENETMNDKSVESCFIKRPKYRFALWRFVRKSADLAARLMFHTNQCTWTEVSSFNVR